MKDNIDTKDLPTTAGTPGLLSNRPGADAPVLSPLFREGALLFAKANLHELAEGPDGPQLLLRRRCSIRTTRP